MRTARRPAPSAWKPPQSRTRGEQPTHFDREKRSLRIGVTELLAEPGGLRIGFARRGGLERLWLGQALHSRVQQATAAGDPSYQSEVRLQLNLDHAGWKVMLHGRADAVREEANGQLVIEEIKSFRRDIPRDRLPSLQAALYAWMLQRERGLPVRAELLWIEIGGGRTTREPVRLDFAALEQMLRARIDQHLERLARESRDRATRRVAANRLRFPHDSLRHGQEQMIQAVASALEGREHLLLQASTGTGKTIACLFPVLRFALANDKQVYFLTAKRLQQEMAMTALAALDPEEVPLAVKLGPKARMCANETMSCHEDYCRFARDLAFKLHKGVIVRRLLQQQSVVDPETIFELALATEICPFELGLACAREAVVTVCDYNYAFDPFVSLQAFSPDADLSDTILIIDEIHNLVDRARQIASPVLEGALIRSAERCAAMGGATVHREIETLCGELLDVVAETVLEAGAGATPESWALEHPLPSERLFALRPRFDAAFLDYLEYRIDTRSMERDDVFVALYFALVRFLEFLRAGSYGFAQLVEQVAGSARLRLLCTDPSKRLGSIFERCHSAIGLSATLNPFEVHREMLGLERERSVAVAIPHPFPPEHQRVVIDTSVTTRWRDRARQAPRIARRITEFAAAVPGHCLALLPSHAFLADIADRLLVTDKMLLRQRADDGEHGAILDHLRDPHSPPALLMAVAGGVFAEGVDYPGERLRGVLVVGPCAPAPDLERQLLEREYEERFESGFLCAYAIPGMTRVVQAAGRLIRSERNQGVIALLGRRFLREPYRSLLPDAWLGGRPAEELVGNPATVALRFFAGVKA